MWSSSSLSSSSSSSSKKYIAQGDLVIIWLTRDLVQSLIVTPGDEFNSRYGHYRHSDLIGIPFGSKVPSRTGKGFVHVLRPTPELWTLALPHRTQILYLPDIAFITSSLHIRPGSIVIEAGTGSGSFTHSVARTVGSTGHVFSYEFHEARANKAAEEFARHGMSDIVTLTHRNVCKNGFIIIDTADSVFLDLPAPWEAIEHAKSALKKDRLTRICCFSPCIEQVLRTVSALNDAGFTDITMYETLLRPHEVNEAPRLAHIGSVTEKLKQLERKREEKRLRQIAASREGRRYAEKRKREESPEVNAPVNPANSHSLEPPDAKKKVKSASDDDDPDPDVRAMAMTTAVDMDVDVDVGMDEVLENETENENENGPPAKVATAVEVVADNAVLSHLPRPSPSPATQILSKHSKEVRGHTSFLTFACLVPVVQPRPEPQTTIS
ncbi:tRNA methyltransferase complex GCD14 subunit-domain-containing protein [Multifurca ochricompacta]|uniref:tRNA (adenine(58)-N(1))-methyltransferase catalytic subunit TRM61 n=1 Tax=Multifurca ochricompacta TaxID=376703 RepID=A0AAD4QL44_9AGAM|nr:tRNA methyltransferase complex GCD14 subunit-domain-containing protein [Multifurca ochricompacta]